MDDKREHTLVRDGLVTVSQGSRGSVGQPLQVQQTLIGQTGTLSTNIRRVNVRTYCTKVACVNVSELCRCQFKHCNHVSEDVFVFQRHKKVHSQLNRELPNLSANSGSSKFLASKTFHKGAFLINCTAKLEWDAQKNRQRWSSAEMINEKQEELVHEIIPTMLFGNLLVVFRRCKKKKTKQTQNIL